MSRRRNRSRSERRERCRLGSDACVVDEESFFLGGCLEVPIVGEADPLAWGVWVSLSDASFVELEPTDHLLAVEQHSGTTGERVAEILSLHLHGG